MASFMRRSTRRLALLLAITTAVVQFGDFVWALRRYTVGLGSVINPLARVRGGWSPPIPSVVLVIATAIVIIAYGWWIVLSTVRPHGSGVIQTTNGSVGPQNPAPSQAPNPGTLVENRSAWFPRLKG